MVSIFLVMFGLVATNAYPVSYNSCGIDRTVSQSPQRIVTMNQGATELMLALGLADKMVGTAYLDDYIWPKYASAYANIPVLSSSYPNETTIMSKNPDFIVGSYRSAFYQVYQHSSGSTRGIFSNATVGPCVGAGTFSTTRPTCRPQLHSDGISTFLFQDACENASLRPATVTEQTVYEEMRALGRIFSVDAEALITDMQNDFNAAAAAISNAGTQMKAVWLDCVGRCCTGGPEPQVFVGAGSGVPGMLMTEAGLTNVFADRDGGWACVNVSDIAAANPDVFVIADAAWDTGLDKITWLYNNSDFCNFEAVQGARLVQIPFSATTLSPRNGPAALDLAIASLHVRTGSVTPVRESGVSSFALTTLQSHIAGLRCPLVSAQVVYTDATSNTDTTGAPSNTGTNSPTNGATSNTDTSSASPQEAHMLWLLVLAYFVACS
jgi:iron complex transport system substrate-binding protein